MGMRRDWLHSMTPDFSFNTCQAPTFVTLGNDHNKDLLLDNTYVPTVLHTLPLNHRVGDHGNPVSAHMTAPNFLPSFASTNQTEIVLVLLFTLLSMDCMSCDGV